MADKHEESRAMYAQVAPLAAAVTEFLALSGGGPLALDLEALTLARAAGRSAARQDGQTAIIPVVGPLAPRGFSSFFFGSVMGMDDLRSMLADAVANDAVSTIVLDFDCPGGTVDGTPETAAAVAAAASQKRVVAVANTLMASAACWIGAQASEIVISPSGRAGSIGVMGTHTDISGALAQAGISMTVVSAPQDGFKAERTPYKPLTPEALASMQSDIDAAYATFVKDVASGRKVSQAKVKADFGMGRVLSASQAVAAGLADRVATLDDVLRGHRGATSAKLPRRSALAFV